MKTYQFVIIQFTLICILAGVGMLVLQLTQMLDLIQVLL